MNVLITGGAGYIGNELTFRLIENPEIDKIIIYDNLSRRNYNLFLDTKYPESKVKFVRGELLDTRKIRTVLKDIDVVCHLAAKVSTPFANEDSHLFEQINHWGTAELVYAVEESNVKKFIYTSSTSIYGASHEFIDINSTPNPKTFYGSSKLRSEPHVKRLGEKIPSYILRCGNVYGYSPSVRFDAVINRFMFEANFTGRIQISGNGMQHRAFVHVDKVVNVILNLLNHDFEPDTYNLVEKNISINEVADVVKEIYPDLEIIFINQHLTMREILIKQDDRLKPMITRKDRTLKEELLSFKERFAFSS
ncbi:NAD-dependent epimerase/dehydratase family protein [Bacteroidota bacterium]